LEARNGFFFDTAYRVVAVRDITYRKQQEAALKESKERYRILFEQNAVGLVIVRRDGQIFNVNQKFCDTLNYSKDELLQKTLLDICFPDDIEVETHNLELLFSAEINDLASQMRYFTRNKQIIWAYAHSHVIKKSNGEVDYIIKAVADITDSVKAQHKIVEQNQMLIQKEMELNAALEAKELLLKEVHHRVKNNLQTISSLLNQQKNLSNNPKIAEALCDSISRVMSMALTNLFINRTIWRILVQRITLRSL
jgi:PAS domain S-box-containing protein